MELSIFRLLDTNISIILPQFLSTQLLVSSEDVLHTWNIPRIGIKVDAVPGRINRLGVSALRSGVFYGQCSEICGAYHSFMPIKLEVTDLLNFNAWVVN